MFALVKNQTITDPITQETSEIEVIKLFAPYTIWEDKNGTQYSPDSLLSLNASQKQDLGIYDVAYGTRLDDRFYNVTENAPTFDKSEKIVKVTFTSTPKELEDDGDVIGLKTNYINLVKTTANRTLAETDWMLVRKIERSVDVPAEVVTARAAIVTAANTKVAAITAATNVEQLIALVG
jgi:hypothetical protein